MSNVSVGKLANGLSPGPNKNTVDALTVADNRMLSVLKLEFSGYNWELEKMFTEFLRI